MKQKINAIATALAFFKQVIFGQISPYTLEINNLIIPTMHNHGIGSVGRVKRRAAAIPYAVLAARASNFFLDKKVYKK